MAFRSLKKDREDDFMVRKSYHHARRRFLLGLIENPDLDEFDKSELVKGYVDLDNSEWEWESQNSDYYFNKGFKRGWLCGIVGATVGVIFSAWLNSRKSKDE